MESESESDAVALELLGPERRVGDGVSSADDHEEEDVGTEADTLDLQGATEDEPEEADEEEEDDDEQHDASSVAVSESHEAFFRHTPTSTPEAAVAPTFPAVHRSWEAFDAQLKTYAQSTYQLYVVRTTTSVARRNLRIAELTAGSSNADTDEGDADRDVAGSTQHDRLMIPAHHKWYSKTMMCTHGWKDRHRGTGKRSLTNVRSTGCPVKMCITLQQIHHDAAAMEEEDDGWRVVVTKHMRTHNHPLSKELYLFYTENRRIYDPELLALVGGNSPSGTALSVDFYGAFGDDDDELSFGPSADDPSMTGESITPMTPKAFESWEHFHEVLSNYSVATQQHFRIRSTISAQSKNAKVLEQAAKTGKTDEEVSIHLVPEAQKWFSKLLICNHGWKRKSRSKIAKSQQQGGIADWNDPSPSTCPAMIMARLQRDIRNKWRIVINRQVIHHNHALYRLESSEADRDARLADDRSSDLEEASAAVALMNQQLAAHTAEGEQNEEFVSSAVHHIDELQLHSSLTMSTDPKPSDGTPLQSVSASALNPSAQAAITEAQPVPRPMSIVTEVVVRVAKLQAIHESWEAFHAVLQQYSENTYQSYRTRTTSSVAGRNQKILEMRASNESSLAVQSSSVREASADRDGVGSDATRLIPEQYKWYSKTLTCTHGWKERRRGSGKRTIHVVRSTLCPVKICATLQYLEADSTVSGQVGWRVVVTKHIVDHNHNLSKELYQHYRDNRRIYDPALLAIDQTNKSDATGASVHALTNNGSTDPRQNTESIDSAPINGEQPAGFGGDAPIGFDQTDAFNSQHSLPESAYLVPSGANPNQSLLMMTNGMMSFPTIPTQTTTQLSTGMGALTVSAPGAQQEMFAHGAIFPSSTYSATQESETYGNPHQDTTPINVVCQVHEDPSSNQTSEGQASECTCARTQGEQHYTSIGTDAASADSSNGKRRYRASESHRSDPTPVSKRVRPETAMPHLERRDNTSASPMSPPMAITGSEHSVGPQAQVWSPENRVPAIVVTESDGTVVWRAPRLKRRHENWAEFTDHLDAYSKSTLQLYRVRTTSSIAARNVRISQQLQQLQEEGGRMRQQDEEEFVPHLVPPSYEWYSKTYVCTHGWKERRRGKGQRVSHNLRSTACPVKLCVTLQRDPHNVENWNVVVTKHVLDHNHEISQSMFQSYSENRRIKDPQLLAQAEQMWREGHPRRKVFEFLKGATKTNIVMKDIHNLVQRWQQQRQQEPPTSTTSVADTLSQIPHAHGVGGGPGADLDLIV